MLLNRPVGTGAQDVPTLRLMTCSTAPLTLEQWLRFEQMYGVKLLQMYGMSEAGWMCGNRHYKSKMGTVGLPALHQELEIVDAQGKPCPPGVEGEVTAGGPHCAVGYLLDDGTIEPIRGKRIKSGDLAVMDADGFIRVSGRTKDLIIRGGVNIAPLEIDEVLLEHPGVLDAAAVGVPDSIYGEEVVCYVVARPGARPDRSRNRRALPDAASPAQKCPSRFSSYPSCRKAIAARSCATSSRTTGTSGPSSRHEQISAVIPAQAGIHAFAGRHVR